MRSIRPFLGASKASFVPSVIVVRAFPALGESEQFASRITGRVPSGDANVNNSCPAAILARHRCPDDLIISTA